jgi:hypothetical protein
MTRDEFVFACIEDVEYLGIMGLLEPGGTK